MTDADEWLTISTAAKRLGISERQARRDVSHLPDSDRRTTGRGPARVRLKALSEYRDAIKAEETGDDPSPADVRSGPAHDRPEDGDDVGHESGASPPPSETEPPPPDGRDELIEQLRGEVGRLNAALERSQVALSQALTSLSSEQDRTRQLETSQTRLIEALPVQQPQNEMTTGTATGASPADVRPTGLWARLGSLMRGNSKDQ